MKKNLFLAMGMLAAFGVLACGGKEDPTVDPGHTDAGTDTKPTNTDHDSATEEAANCANEVLSDGSTELVCGTCTTTDQVKGECLSNGYVEAAKIPASLKCVEDGSRKVWVATIKDSCMDTEVCEAGACKLDESKLGPCANVTTTCEGNILKFDYPEACTDFEDAETDCTNLGGCDSVHGACKHANGICEDDEKTALTTVCDGRTIVVKYADKACGEGNYVGSAIKEEKSCLSYKLKLGEGADAEEVTVAGTCFNAECVKDEHECSEKEKFGCPDGAKECDEEDLVSKEKQVCVGDDLYKYYTTCGRVEYSEEACQPSADPIVE